MSYTEFEEALAMMQGRLSPIKGGRIQSFPWQNWKQELNLMKIIGISKLEWTIDLWHFYKNPIIKNPINVARVCKSAKIKITSVTSDAHMHGNFWTEHSIQKNKRKLDKLTVNLIRGMSICGIRYLIIPLVDESSIENDKTLNNVRKYFIGLLKELEDAQVNVLFESDMSPSLLGSFIKQFPSNYFGINYDIGNSASLGYNPDEEFANYGKHIKNVHIKDRPLNGGSCFLGSGDADFEAVVRNLREINYLGDFVMQTARSMSGNHLSVLQEQIEFWRNKWDY